MGKFLNIEGLNAAYEDTPALWDVSLEINSGEIVALIGSNGAGKTTIMRTIAGLHQPTSGKIELDGVDLTYKSAYNAVDQGIILVPEGRRLFGNLTVLDNLELGAYTKRARAIRHKTIAQVYELFPILKEKQTHYANTLSGGQQQMLAIARALMGLPRLLLLDEPSLGLAPIVVENIFKIIKYLNGQGVTIFLVEQNAMQALELANQAFILEQGRIVGSGTGRGLLKNDEVRQAYLGLTPRVDEEQR